ncbi:hypothetical protein NMY22_g14891 [Coprinellus aureogranulatus]|nr:hypothetical protein NMY22_g14891 [Coprinellus aureogranulatus]
MSSKTSKSLKQSTLSFGASKATAAANRAKKDAGTVTAEPSSSNSKRPTRSATKPTTDESNLDDIELSKSEPSSEEEIEQGDSEEYTADKHDKGKGAAVKRETRASKAKAKVAKKEDETGKQSVEEIAASRPNLDVKNRAYDQISSETRKKMGHLKTIHPT